MGLECVKRLRSRYRTALGCCRFADDVVAVTCGARLYGAGDAGGDVLRTLRSGSLVRQVLRVARSMPGDVELVVAGGAICGALFGSFQVGHFFCVLCFLF